MQSRTVPTIDLPILGKVDIRPTGKFCDLITEGLSQVMVAAISQPLDEVLADIKSEHPDIGHEDALQLAKDHISAEWMANGNRAIAEVVGRGSLMYKLAAAAIGQEFEWTHEHLMPQDVKTIVTTAIKVGEVIEYLGESLTLLYTVMPAMQDAELTAGDEKRTDAQSRDGSEDSSLATTD